MLIPNQFDRRTNLHGRKLTEFHDEFGDLVAPEYVVDSQQIREATERGITLFGILDEELQKTGRDARDAFVTNATELHDRLN